MHKGRGRKKSVSKKHILTVLYICLLFFLLLFVCMYQSLVIIPKYTLIFVLILCSVFVERASEREKWKHGRMREGVCVCKVHYYVHISSFVWLIKYTTNMACDKHQRR